MFFIQTKYSYKKSYSYKKTYSYKKVAHTKKELFIQKNILLQVIQKNQGRKSAGKGRKSAGKGRKFPVCDFGPCVNYQFLHFWDFGKNGEFIIIHDPSKSRSILA